MLSRIVSALVLVPAVLGLLFFAPPYLLLAVLGLIGTLCLREYFMLTARMGLTGQSWFGYAALWALLLGLYSAKIPYPAIFAMLAVFSLAAAVWRPASMKQRAAGAMVDLLGVLYLGLCLYTALLLRFEFGDKAGLHWLLTLLGVIWAGDVAALFVGRSIGRNRLAPAISPNKTVEGAVGGLLAGVLAAAALQKSVFTDLPLEHVIAVSLILGMAGQMGDLAESMLKRAADVKDSSQLIPGHGGVLDRLDSLLFAFPVLYCYLSLLQAG